VIVENGIKIFATFPCIKFGSICLYEYFISKIQTERFDAFSIPEIDAAFDLIYPMNFLQKRQVNLKEFGSFSIEALSAGYSIGGAAWKITLHQNNQFVFAFDINDKNEKISVPLD
jgi:Cft2 family RNA processing exonuclease